MPPASFDERDVAVAAKRATARRRMALAGGGAFVIAVLAVGLVVGGGILGRDPLGTTTSSAGARPTAAPRPRPAGVRLVTTRHPARAGAKRRNRFPGFPTATPLQGGGGVGGVGPGAGGTPSGCGPTDRELAVALANELSSVGAPPQAVPAGVSCPSGSRAAAYLVHDGTDAGYIVAVVTPAGKPAAADPANGAARAVVPASGGRQVTVLSVPASVGALAPLTGGLIGFASDLAGKV